MDLDLEDDEDLDLEDPDGDCARQRRRLDVGVNVKDLGDDGLDLDLNDDGLFAGSGGECVIWQGKLSITTSWLDLTDVELEEKSVQPTDQTYGIATCH